MDGSADQFYSNAFFDVVMEGKGENGDVKLEGRFTSVSGLGMEVEYEVYNEGGSLYPHYFLKEAKPQTLVLEQGVMTDADAASDLMAQVNSGVCVAMEGTITMKDRLGEAVRSWTIVGAHLRRYAGPDFSSGQPAVAVNRMEFMYNGCY